MNAVLRQLTLEEWDSHYAELARQGLREPAYGGPLRRHVEQEHDLRLSQLRFDPSPAALRLWNFLLTENHRLRIARFHGDKLVGAMKDLGTVPVLAYALPGVRAFYPDGAWWTPCLMECSDRLLQQAETLGIDASFCPVRAMLGAFENEQHFPLPDLLVCSAGAVCDDFSAIAQRLEHRGHPVLWWEIPRRRLPEPGEASCALPGGLFAPQAQVDCVREELERIAVALGILAGCELDLPRLQNGIREANRVRAQLGELRHAVYAAPGSPLPALEMLIAEMLAIHFCSDREECLEILADLTTEARHRAQTRQFIAGENAARVFWINPVADLRAMNLLEACGGRLCGTDFMFTHALDLIPEDLPGLDALARIALADPMAGSALDRARRIVLECRKSRAEAVVVSRIPGASHCPWETPLIQDFVREQMGLPVVEVEIPPVCDALIPALRTRLQAVMEIAWSRRTI
ncbi:MAG TPA: 2-hydroxyacyl-CoA dehydratase family protein [Candidatus Paceibacterota bacterium]|nr:2-hydroxyacyl-CoA dehydratase family protein [Candidatus Paceibacterota bacterium]